MMFGADLSDLPQIDGICWEAAYNHFFDMSLMEDTIREFYKMIDIESQELLRLSEQLDNEENVALYRSRVHAMKSTAALIGALQLSGMAKLMENAAKEQNVEMLKVATPVFIKEWNLYKEKLAAFGEEKEKIEITDVSVILAYLDMLMGAAAKMDLGTLDQAMEELLKYRYPGNAQIPMNELQRAVTNLETKRVEEIAKEVAGVVRNIG